MQTLLHGEPNAVTLYLATIHCHNNIDIPCLDESKVTQTTQDMFQPYQAVLVKGGLPVIFHAVTKIKIKFSPHSLAVYPAMSSASASSASLTAMKGQILVCKIAVFCPPLFPVFLLQTTMPASNASMVSAPQVRQC